MGESQSPPDNTRTLECVQPESRARSRWVCAAADISPQLDPARTAVAGSGEDSRGAPSTRGVLSMRGRRGPSPSAARVLGATPPGDACQPLFRSTRALPSPLQSGSARPAAPGSSSQTPPQARPCCSRQRKEQTEPSRAPSLRQANCCTRGERCAVA